MPEEWAEEIKDIENDEDPISYKLNIVVGHISFDWEDMDGVRSFLRIMGASEDEMVPSRVMRKLVCSLWLNEVSRQ